MTAAPPDKETPAMPITEPWQAQADCLGQDLGLFFPEKEDGASAVKKVQEAKTICRRCPVRDRCLEEHLGEIDGVWGATTPNERRELRRQRRRVERAA